jgi:penicillin-binding protein 1C
MRAGCVDDREASNPLAIVSPAAGSAIFVPVEVGGERGRAVFDASHRDRAARVHWHLDSDFLGTTTAPHQMALAPSSGVHTLTLVDEEGHRVSRSFSVLSGAAE